MANFSTVVELYRKSSNRSFDGRSFSATVDIDSKTSILIDDLKDSSSTCGKFEDVEIDGKVVDIYDDIKLIHGNVINYNFVPSKYGAERFYVNKEEFIKINSIKKGIIPFNYFITSIDFFSHDTIKPDFIEKIERICSVIKSLSGIAHYHDTKSELDNYRLVFVKNSDSKSTSIVLETSFDDKMILNNLIDDTILKEFTTNDHSHIPHYGEKLGTFRNTLVEFITDNGFTFSELIEQWSLFLKLFENNLSTYMSGFSFHKARNEVAKAESEMADKLSKIISDISLKILSIPISFIAALGMLKMNGILELVISFVGLLITSTLVILMVMNQEKQFIRICHSKELMFKPIQSKANTYPEDLAQEISSVVQAFDENQKLTQFTLLAFKVLSGLPTFIALIILIVKVTDSLYKTGL